MKITCDLCGGSLQMNAGGQGAVCTVCGMLYSMERMREKLQALTGNAPASSAPVTATSVSATPVSAAPVSAIPVSDAPVSSPIPDISRSQTNVAAPSSDVVKPVQPPVQRDNGRFTLLVHSASQPIGRDCILNCHVEKGYVTVGSRVEVMEWTWLGHTTKQCTVTSIMQNGKLVRHAEEGAAITVMIDQIKKKNLMLDARGTRMQGAVPANLRVSQNSSAAASGTCSQPAVPVAGSAYAFGGDVAEYFDRLLRSAFSDCRIDRHVDVAPKLRKKVPADFVITAANRRSVAVILCPKRAYDADYIENTMEACRRQSIVPLRFFEEFENRADYVCSRIRNELR